MCTLRILLSTSVVLSLAGCMQSHGPTVSSRSNFAENAAVSAMPSEDIMAQQTHALTKMTKDIIRKSTVNGAIIGAVAGCGLVVISAANAKNCIGGALVGGSVGALAGNANGKKNARKRIELVSPNALARSIGKADKHMDLVTRDLPTLLAQQDKDIAALTQSMKNGQITEAQYVQRFNAIKTNRAELAQSLSLSAAQANEAHRNLEAARSQGQTGLDWHLSATKNLARDATSARSNISLL